MSGQLLEVGLLRASILRRRRGEFFEHRCDGLGRAGPCLGYQPRNARLGFSGATCLLTAKIVAARPGMRVEHEQLLVLGGQQPQQLAERGVLQKVGEIAGVIAVAVVHTIFPSS